MGTMTKGLVGLTLTMAGVMLLGTMLSAQQAPQETPRPSPEEQMQRIRQMMEAISASRGPMRGQIMASTIDTLLATMAEKEFAEKLATFVKNYYDALLAQGFTEKQALQIIAATSIPPLMSVK
jgi:hypothetical protein